MVLLDEPSTELLDVLCKRSPLLKLIGDDVTDKRTLEDALGCSRSTLNRGIRELESNGLIECSPGDLELTLAGEVAFRAFSDVWEPLAEAVPLFEHLDDAPFAPAVLQGGSVVQSSMAEPDAPVEALASRLDSAEHVRATVPTRDSSFAHAMAERIESIETAEFLVPEAVLEASCETCDLAFDLDALTAACSIQKIDERPPYSVVVTDDEHVWLGIYDAQGKFVGAILNDRPAAVEWATETHRRALPDRQCPAQVEAGTCQD